MKVTGVMVVFVDVPRGAEAEFNRWYDTDHLPEICGVDGVIAARRYHAEDAIMQYRSDKLENAPPIGQARYCATYLLGDPDLAAVKARMAECGKRLNAAGRSMPHGKAVFVTWQRLIHAYASPRLKLSTEALPYVGHRGLQVAMGHTPDPAHIADVTDWWQSHHYPDMLSVPGWAAVMKCEPLGEEGKGTFMHLFLTEAPAAKAHEALEKVLPQWRAENRNKHPRGYYKRIFSGPFSQITPLEYDFLR
jgi:hypothetical protein